MKKSLVVGMMILLFSSLLMAACSITAGKVNIIGKWSVDAGQEARIYEPAGTTFEFKTDGTLLYQAPDDTDPTTYYYIYYDPDLLVICSVEPCTTDGALGYAHMAVSGNHMVMIAFEELVNLTKVP
jgi:hypothetical protein